jgi:hypothetical protein
MPLVRRFAFLTAGYPENGGAHNRGVVARSFFRSVRMMCGAWPPCHKVGTLVHVGGDFARDASGARVGRSAFKKGVDLPGSRHASLLLRPSRPSAFRASRWGTPVFSRGIRVKAVPSGDLTAGELALVVVPPILSSSCCCWRSATPWGLAFFHHHSASRIFITQPGRNLRPVVIHKDDYQPCGGEKRAGLRPPPCPQLQGGRAGLRPPPFPQLQGVDHPRWGGGRAELGSCPPHGLMWSPPLVRLPTTEVVASAGETVSATCRRTPGSLALMASLSPPVGRRERGPFRSGIRAEVVATAGELSVQRRPSPSVLVWSPPLASRSELAIPRPLLVWR